MFSHAPNAGHTGLKVLDRTGTGIKTYASD